MKKKSSLPALKRKCWDLMSQYARRSAANANGYAACYTCGFVARWQDQQAGHFVPGRTGSVLLNLENVRVQCQRCNIWKGGNYHAFTLRMIDEVGREKVEELLALKRQTKKWSRGELETLRDELLAKLARIG